MNPSLSPQMLRWRDIGLYSLVGGFLGPRLSQILDELVRSLCEPLESSSELAVWAAHTITVSLLLLAIWRFISPKLAHFRRWNVWPPLLFCVPIGLWIFMLMGILPGVLLESTESPPLFSWLALAITATVFIAVAVILSKRAMPEAVAASNISQNESLEALTSVSYEILKNWLQDESPIESHKHDMIGNSQRARRLSKSLIRSRNSKEPNLLQSMIIQGPFGIGKTSLIRMMKQETQMSHTNIIFVDINCWGFSTLGAQEHALEKIVEAIGERFDCLGLQQLPNAYAHALQESSGWIHGILEMLDQRSNDPVGILQKISPILTATDTFLVVIIEESDRNDHEFEQKKIEALLHRLRQVERVSFILAATESSQIDFTKVAEKIEPVPSLDPSITEAVLARMINQWGDPLKLGFIDPFAEATGQRAWLENLQNPRHCIKIFAALVRTPRKLKHVLREVDDAWQLLKGEVDLYDLLCVAILRHCASSVFDFAVVYHRDFTSLMAGSQEENKARASFLKTELNNIVKMCGADPKHISLIFERLFPHVIIPDHEDDEPGDFLMAHLSGTAQWPLCEYQTLKRSRTEMYWQRLLSCHVDDFWPKDQEVIQELKQLENAQNLEGVAKKCITLPHFRDAATLFLGVSVLRDHNLARLLAGAVLRHARPIRAENGGIMSAGFLWINEWLPNDVDSVESKNELTWYEQNIKAALNADMDDALCIYCMGRNRMEGRKHAAELKSKTLDLLRVAWSPELQHLSLKCRPGFSAVLFDILYEVVSDGDPLNYLSDVPPWIGDLIIRDLHQDPMGMAVMVHAVLRGPKKRPIELDIEKSKKLFGNRWREALALMAKGGANSSDAEFPQSDLVVLIHRAAHQALTEAPSDEAANRLN